MSDFLNRIKRGFEYANNAPDKAHEDIQTMEGLHAKKTFKAKIQAEQQIADAQHHHSLSVINSGMDAQGYSDIQVEKARVPIQHDDLRGKKQIEFEYEQKGIQAEVDGTIKLAETDQVLEDADVSRLRNYYADVEALETEPQSKRRDRELALLEQQIEKLEAKLHEPARRMVSQADAGQVDEGRDEPPQPRSESSAAQRLSRKSNSAEDSGMVG